MDYKERGSPRNAYTWRMWKTRVNQLRGRSRHKNYSERVTNMEKMNVETKGKSPKQDLASAKDLTIKLPGDYNQDI